MFNPEKKLEPKKITFDKRLIEQDREDIHCHRGLAQYGVHEMDKTFIMLWNSSWIEAQVLRSLIMLDSFLSTKVKNVLFLNLSVPFQPATEWPVLKKLQQMAQKSNMILFDNTYYSVNLDKNKPVDFDTHGWMGHHGPNGNHHWYESVVHPKLKELSWI